ncbi:histone demethylase UTY-like isoform X2 [Oscarella lobularis]|uniref:histone demethylase UTY-like isoform X2 n=1 Tax=Oscarella lobularis TaxID=121494 RepID=UPI0033139704
MSSDEKASASMAKASTLTDNENTFLNALDSRDFGFISLGDQFDSLQTKRQVIEKGIEHYEILALKNGKEEDVAWFFCQLGHLHLLLQNFAKALSAYKKFIKLQGEMWRNNICFLYGLALVYFHYNAFSWAVELFYLLLQFGFSHVAEVHLRLAVIFKISGRFDDSLQHFRFVLSSWTHEHCSLTPLEIHFHIAHLFEVQGKAPMAKMNYERILDSPNASAELQANVYRQLGWIQYTLGAAYYGEAIQLLQKSVELNKACWESWYYLGRCYSSSGLTHEAFTAYRKAIDNNETRSDTWCSIGVLYQRQGQLMDALQAYVCAVRLDRQHVVAWADMGILYEALHQILDAMTCYQEAMTVSQIGCPERTSVESRLRTLAMLLRWHGLPPNSSQQKLPSVSDAFYMTVPSELLTRTIQRGIVNETLAQAKPPPIPDLSQIVAQYSNEGFQQNSGDVFQYPFMPPPPPPPPPNPSTPFIFPAAAAQSRFPLGWAAQLRAPPCAPTQMRPMNPAVPWFVPPQPQPPPLQVPQPPPPSLSVSLPPPPPPLPSPSKASDPMLSEAALRVPPRLKSSNSTDLLNVIGGNPSALPEIDVTDVLGTTNEAALLSPSLLDSLSPARLAAAAARSGVGGETSFVFSSSSATPFGNASFLAVEPVSTLADEREYMTQTPLAPPLPPTLQTNQDLHPNVPSMKIRLMTDVHGHVVREFCFSPANPIVLLEGLAQAADLDLSLFSSQQLAETNGEHRMEIRTQRQQAADENWDGSGKRKVWKCSSALSHMTISSYAKYQESYGQTSSSEEEEIAVSARQFKTIQFGTNADLSDEITWSRQLKELEKIPEFARVKSSSNLLNFVNYPILGVNSVQLYMKVPGCRTPGHQENLNFCSVNLNIGPDDSEWFAVPTVYWGAINSLCEKHRIDFLTGSWWPNLDELESEGIPVYRFRQKAGDLVWVNPGAVHWVQAAGICNNVAWNVGPVTAHQYRMAMERYEWNKIKRAKSIVPMSALSWSMAKKLHVTDVKLFEQLRNFIERSAREAEYHTKRLKQEGHEITWRGKADDERDYYCTNCEIEVFNLLFVCNKKGTNYVYCESCARKNDKKFQEHVIANQYSQEEMNSTIAKFRLH